METINLFDEMNELEKQNILNNEEKYISKGTYRKFNLRDDDHICCIDTMCKIKYDLTHYNESLFWILENKLVELQSILLKACNDIYSERIIYNLELQQLVKTTIIPYYQGRFIISYSREISFLPLELRLYIYCNIFELESHPIHQMHLMDRIAITLYKKGESFLGDFATFLKAWLGFRVEQVKSFTTSNFSDYLAKEVLAVKKISDLRENILTEAEMTSEILEREFWYGFKSFSSLDAINDKVCAEISLKIFCSYFSKSFSIVSDLETAILYYYKTADDKLVKELINVEGLDKVTITSKYIKPDGSEFENYESKIIANKLQGFVKKTMDYNKNFEYLYWNKGKEKIILDTSQIPDMISQQDFLYFAEKLDRVIQFKCAYIPNINEYVLYLTTAMLNSKDWDFEMLNLNLGILLELTVFLWGRKKEDKKDLSYLLKIFLLINKPSIKIPSIGDGWITSIVVQEGKANNFVYYKSQYQYLPSYIEYSYVNLNPINSDKEFIKQIDFYILRKRNIKLNWSYMEKSRIFTKSMNRKRRKGWDRINNERKKYVKTV